MRALDGDLVIAGDSAGGNLAAVIARKLRDRFKLQVLIYPVTDAGVNTPSYAEFDEGHGLTAAAMRRFWGLYLNGGSGLDPDASPLRAQDLDGVAPALHRHRQPRRPARRGRGLCGGTERAGVPVTLKRLEGTIHGFWRWQTTADRARRGP